MKNVVLIGASGFVGTAILNELLNRGHKVTAIVRDPAKVTASNPNLKVIQADVTDTLRAGNPGAGRGSSSSWTGSPQT